MSRSEVQTGESITLRTTYRNRNKKLVDPTAPPELYIYDPTVESATITEEVEAGTYASALAGPLTSTQVSAGFYEYEYTVPSGGEEGIWTHVWVAPFDTSESKGVMRFTVFGGDDIFVVDECLEKNKLIIIKFSSEIADTLGNLLTSEQVITFFTELDPFYASPEQVRACAGPFIEDISDMTLALYIHGSSVFAKTMQPIGLASTYAVRMNWALNLYVTCDAALKAISAALSDPNSTASASSGTKWKKTLGDMTIEVDGTSGAASAAANLDKTIARLERCKEDMTNVIMTGGALAPGQSFDPVVAVKGICLPGRMNGRNWLEPDEWHYRIPIVDSKVVPDGHYKSYGANQYIATPRYSRGASRMYGNAVGTYSNV